MAAFVLVHGGSVTGAVWDPVTQFLAAAGHTVYAPTLTEESTATFSGHVAEVIQVISGQDLDDVILCGHSYGGLVAAACASGVVDRVAHLVLLDCFLPVNGRSLWDLATLAGIDMSNPDLTPDPPYVEPIQIDLRQLDGMPKTYVRCLDSEFRASWSIVGPRVKAGELGSDMRFFEISSVHNLMQAHPVQTARILLGAVG